METRSKPNENASIASSVAPEDLRRGDFVAVLNEVVEFPSFFWCDSLPNERDEPVRVRRIPTGSGTPLKVKAICLPFVFVKSPHGQCETVDIRQVQLVRLKNDYAKTVWRHFRKQRPKLAARWRN